MVQFDTCFIYTPTRGDDPIWRAYFSNGLNSWNHQLVISLYLCFLFLSCQFIWGHRRAGLSHSQGTWSFPQWLFSNSLFSPGRPRNIFEYGSGALDHFLLFNSSAYPYLRCLGLVVWCFCESCESWCFGVLEFPRWKKNNNIRHVCRIRLKRKTHVFFLQVISVFKIRSIQVGCQQWQPCFFEVPSIPPCRRNMAWNQGIFTTIIPLDVRHVRYPHEKYSLSKS